MCRSTVIALAWLVVLLGNYVDAKAAATGAEPAYPDRPIRLLLGFPAGGSQDALARVLVAQVGNQLGQSFVVDNRTGANGIIAYQLTAKAAPDGYTLVHATASFALNTLFYKKLPYDLHKDFTPITNVMQAFGYLLLVHPSVQAHSVKELIALAKNKDKTLSYGSPGVGHSLHLATELFSSRAGMSMLHVPFKGIGPAMNALLSGEIQVIMVQPIGLSQQVATGRLRALGFTGSKRWDAMPDVPTISETVPGFVAHFSWAAWYAPAKTPRSIVERLQSEVSKALQVPKVRDFFISGGWEPLGSSPEELRIYVDAELKRYAEAARLAKIQPE